MKYGHNKWWCQWNMVTISYGINEIWSHQVIVSMKYGYTKLYMLYCQWNMVTLSYSVNEIWSYLNNAKEIISKKKTNLWNETINPILKLNLFRENVNVPVFPLSVIPQVRTINPTLVVVFYAGETSTADS